MIICANNKYTEILKAIHESGEFTVTEIQNVPQFKEQFFSNIKTALAADPTIRFALEEMSKKAQVFLDCCSVKGSVDLTKLHVKNSKFPTSIKCGGIFDRFLRFDDTNKKNIVEIWARIDELLHRFFFEFYFDMMSVYYKRRMKELSYQIHKIILEKTELLVQYEKESQIVLLKEQTELSFLEHQNRLLDYEIDQKEHQAVALGFDTNGLISDPSIVFYVFQNFTIRNMFLLEEFLNDLEFGQVLQKNFIIVSPKHLQECAMHKKFNGTFMDISFSKKSDNAKFFSQGTEAASLKFSANKLLQIIYNLCTNKMDIILKELVISGKMRHASLLSLEQKLQKNFEKANITLALYFEQIDKELKKLDVDPANLIQVLKLADDMLSFLVTRHEAYLHICRTNVEKYLHTLSFIILYKILDNSFSDGFLSKTTRIPSIPYYDEEYGFKIE